MHLNVEVHLVHMLPEDFSYVIIADVSHGEDMKDVVDLSDRISKHGMNGAPAQI